MWARLKLPINIAQEAEAACLDVGGYLVEPRSENREKHLKDIAEVSNPYTVFTNCFLSEPSPFITSHYWVLNSILQILYNVGFAWSWWLGLSFRESESEDGEQWLWTSDDGVLNPNITYWGSGEVTNKKLPKQMFFGIFAKLALSNHSLT